MAFGDFTVVRSTVKRVLNSSGVLAEVPINTPAFEFNADGTYKGLLVEPAGTNLVTYSQEFDNAAWTKVEVTVSANALASPDGTTTADKLIPTAVASAHALTFPITGAPHTFSVYAKAGEYDVMTLYFNVHESRVDFNLTSGTILASSGATGVIQDMGNGWYRCSAYTATDTHTQVRIYAINGTDFDDNAVAGDGTSGMFLWGAQLETGSVATSYIPTVASTVTRTADSVTLTGASSLIGQQTGAVYAEVDMRQFAGGFRRIVSARPQPTGSNGGFTIVANDLNLIAAAYGVSVTLSPTAYPAGVSKYLITYTAGDIRVYRNGVLLGSSTSAYTHTATQDNLFLATDDQGGGVFQQLNDHIRALALFPTTFTSAQAIAITTL